MVTDIHGLGISTLDYNNSLYMGMSMKMVQKLQCSKCNGKALGWHWPQKTCLTNITGTPRVFSLFPGLMQVQALTHEAVNVLESRYQEEYLFQRTHNNGHLKPLKSLLHIPPANRSKAEHTQRRFLHCHPHDWNVLPRETQLLPSVPSFGKSCKTFLFTVS